MTQDKLEQYNWKIKIENLGVNIQACLELASSGRKPLGVSTEGWLESARDHGDNVNQIFVHQDNTLKIHS